MNHPFSKKNYFSCTKKLPTTGRNFKMDNQANFGIRKIVLPVEFYEPNIGVDSLKERRRKGVLSPGPHFFFRKAGEDEKKEKMRKFFSIFLNIPSAGLTPWKDWAESPGRRYKKNKKKKIILVSQTLNLHFQ